MISSVLFRLMLGLSLIFIDQVCSQAQRTFTCTLPSYCSSGANTIDPRILTPGQQQPAFVSKRQTINIVTPSSTPLNTCPAGYIQCPNANVICGRSTVPISSGDGFATQGSFPWQAYLINGATGQYAGGGALIDQYHVLTAAHKVSNLTSVNVAMGVFQANNFAGAQTSQVIGIWIHSLFNITTLRNDIAILRLATPMNIGGNVVPICTLTTGQSFAAGTRCVVSGWGQTNFTSYDAPTQNLKQVYVPIVAYATCRASFMQTNLLGTNTDIYLDAIGEICAGGGFNQDACTQDGGSPLVCPVANGGYSLAGLVIWGKNCGLTNVYGVYVSASAYSSWIPCTLQCIQGAVACSNCPTTRFR